MISAMNQLLDFSEDDLTEEIFFEDMAVSLGTTEYQLRRLF